MTSNKKDPVEIVNETVGSVLYLYYMFVDMLHTRPRDIDELIDGLLYLDAKQQLKEQNE